MPSWRSRDRPGFVRFLAGPTETAGEADAPRSRSAQIQGLPARDLVADAPADRARRRDDRAADLPADGARVLRDGDRSLARAPLAQHVRDLDRRAREAGNRRPSAIIRVGFALVTIGMGALVPIVPRPTPGGPCSSPCSSRGPAWACWSHSSTTTRWPRSRRADRRGRRELGGGVVRAFVRAGVRRRHHAGDARPRSPTWRTRARCSLPPTSSASRTRWSRMRR